MRRDHAERPGVEHPRYLGYARYAHQWSNAGFQRGDANLPGGFKRETCVLHIDIEAVEACGLGDARDLDAANEPHRHGGEHFATAKLLLDVIAQDFVDRDFVRLASHLNVSWYCSSNACFACRRSDRSELGFVLVAILRVSSPAPARLISNELQEFSTVREQTGKLKSGVSRCLQRV